MVTSSLRAAMSPRRASRGPSKSSNVTMNCWVSFDDSWLGCKAACHALPGQLSVRVGSGVSCGVGRDGFGGDGSVGEFDGAANDGVEHGLSEGFDNALDDFAGVEGAAVEHGGKDAVEVEAWVEAILNLFDGFHEECHTA